MRKGKGREREEIRQAKKRGDADKFNGKGGMSAEETHC